jgi:GNAT superfamily N-acetyltransferase
MPRVYCAGAASGEDVADLIVRTLCQNEREELLDLLDLWPQEAPWTGRTFFRRYIEEDATFEDRNYVVGEEAGRLVACVQIFPRPVRIRGHEVPMGGIGSVFTHPERRGCGHAVKLLEETARRMIERGMETSLLFGIRPMYSPLGWKPWGATARLLSRGEGADVDLDAHDFEPRRDLAEVRAIHESYSGRQEGTVVRDDRLWETSLRVAGNPEEEFLVARRAGRIVAYARAMVSEGFMAISEVGRVEDAADTLAALVARMLTPRDPDPLAPPERSSEQLRGLVAFRAPDDPGLDEAIAALGIAGRVVEDPTVKWRCLDPAGLSRRLGIPLEAGEAPDAYLGRVFPPGRSVFWPSDRF